MFDISLYFFIFTQSQLDDGHRIELPVWNRRRKDLKMSMENTSISDKFIKRCYVLDDQAEIITKFPSDESDLSHIIAVIYLTLLTCTTVFLNGITIITIWHSNILREKTFNFTILMQSVVDLAFGVFVMPLTAFRLTKEITSKTNCMLAFILKKFGILLFLYTQVTLSAMNFDRFLGILHPVAHRRLATNRKLLAYVLSALAFQTVLVACSLTHNAIMRPIMTSVTSIFTLSTVFVYLKIYLKIRETKLTPAGRSAMTGQRLALFLKELKVAKTCFLIVICCLVCSCPVTLSFGPLNLNSSTEDLTMKIWFSLLAMTNSSLNSIIFFWMNQMLRKQGKELINRVLSCCKQ